MQEKSSTQPERIADVEGNVPDIQTEAQTQVIAAKSETFEGPLPHPDILARYENILPGIADRIVRMAEAEQNARHSAIVQDAQKLIRSCRHCSARKRRRSRGTEKRPEHRSGNFPCLHSMRHRLCTHGQTSNRDMCILGRSYCIAYWLVYAKTMEQRRKRRQAIGRTPDLQS